MSVFVTDTHPLVWYESGQHQKLTPQVRRVFGQTATGAAYVHVPSIVLWEIAVLEQEGKIKLNNGFARWGEYLFKRGGFELAPLTVQTAAQAVSYTFNKDPFDRIIVATAAELSFPLITKDAAITESNLVEIYW